MLEQQVRIDITQREDEHGKKLRTRTSRETWTELERLWC
jgi:hypothetical protein